MAQDDYVFSELDMAWPLAQINNCAKRLKDVGAVPVIGELSAGQPESVRQTLERVWEVNKWPHDVQGQSETTYRMLAADLLGARSGALGYKENEALYQHARTQIARAVVSSAPAQVVRIPRINPALRARSGADLMQD